MADHDEDRDLWAVASGTDTFGVGHGVADLVNVHDPAKCAGRACVIHTPSEHHMRSWPLHWRGDKGAMERMCPHGIGHPDPDDEAFHRSIGRMHTGIHGCDRCCVPPTT